MIGKIIKKMRQNNKYSQEQLSKLTFIGRSSISDYEREKTDISFENIEKIANACNYEVVFLSKTNNLSNLTSKTLEQEKI